MAPVQGQSGRTLVTGIVRSEGEAFFTDEEIAMQGQLYPILERCSLRLQKLLPDLPDAEETTLSQDIESALNRFGTSVLTEREHQVIDLVLRGHNTESIASQLDIARDTVKLHRRHSYAKLRVSSQGELFYRFLETLELGANKA